MDSNILQNIYHKHQKEGCFMPYEEWEPLVIKAYAELIRIAHEVPYNTITITYTQLGVKIGLFPKSNWFERKIAWILYACDSYAEYFNEPLITVLVVNSETGQPGKGFWGLPRIPSKLKKTTKIEDTTPFSISGKRDTFWIEELKRIDKWGKSNKL